MHRVRRWFVAGFFVTVPLAVSVAALVWLFQVLDGWARPALVELTGREVPGLGLAVMIVAIVLIGMLATNVLGRRILQRTEEYLLRIPVFRTIYAPVKQLVLAFSPDNEYGFKRVALVHDTSRGLVLGFLTKEFTLDRGQGVERFVALYVPTNHLYLGDVAVFPESAVTYPEISVQQGIQIFLTGGMALPDGLRMRPVDAAGRSRSAR